MLKTLHRLEVTFRFASRALFIPASFLYYFRIGKGHGYPTCCILHFALDGAQRKGSMAVRRGIIFRHTNKAYVPCGFHSGRHPDWEPYSGNRHQLKLF